MNNKTKINSLLEALNDGVFEKEEAIKLSLLSSIAGESIFFLGLPGVAKSLIARRLKFAFKDAKSFEYLMNRFSTPDEVFGPISVIELQNDNYKRIVENYLPASEIVFLDEIWKAGPAIQNTLLTVLNEKKFRNGKEEIDVPLKGLISASNELPPSNDEHGDNVDALWDRFLIRLIVHPVKKEENFISLISNDLKPTIDNIASELKITAAEYKGWNEEINKVNIPEEVFKVIDVVRKKIQEYNDGVGEGKKELYISDRRWRKVIRLLRTSAFLNDRKDVDLMDCFLIKNCIWNAENEIETVEGIIEEAVRTYGYNLTIDTKSIKKQIEELNKEVKGESEYEEQYQETHYKLYNKIYLKFEGLQTYPQYSWIKLVDWKKIDTTQKTFDLYSSNFSDSRNMTIYKVDEKFMIADSSWSTCTTEIEQVTKKRVKVKKPNKRIIASFDNEVNEISIEIDRQISVVENHKRQNLQHLQSNLFVHIDYAEIVEENLHNSIQELRDLRLESEKIKEYYDGLER